MYLNPGSLIEYPYGERHTACQAVDPKIETSKAKVT